MYRTGRAAILLWRQASPEFTPATARPSRGWDVRVLRDSRVQLPQRRAVTSAGTDIAPGAGTLTLTGYAPSIAQPHGVTPGVGALTITGYAPTVEQVSGVQPGVGTLTLSGHAPTVTQPHGVTPGVGALTLTGHAPVVTQVANIAPAVGSLAFTGYAPTIAQPIALAPAVGSLVITGYAPTVDQAAAAGHVHPGTGTLTLTGFAPTVDQAPVTIARPTSDILTTGWTAVPGGSLYDMIDEASPSDADYITRAQAGTEPAIFGIPQVPAGPNTIRIRAAATSGSGQVRVLLLDGSGSTVGTSAWQSIDATPTTYALSVVASAAAARVRIEAS